jgi:hypothetical protein
MSEGYVQVALDSTGKKIRNLSVDVVQPDGTISTVQMQVININDQYGVPIDFSGRTNQLLNSLLSEMKGVRRILATWTGLDQTQIAADATPGEV